MEQALREVGLGGGRFGWHSFRRKFATELKHIPLKDLCDLGGWKDSRTVAPFRHSGIDMGIDSSRKATTPPGARSPSGVSS
jgi:hypothetical protein